MIPKEYERMFPVKATYSGYLANVKVKYMLLGLWKQMTFSPIMKVHLTGLKLSNL
jgi:hypothetical protein